MNYEKVDRYPNSDVSVVFENEHSLGKYFEKLKSRDFNGICLENFVDQITIMLNKPLIQDEPLPEVESTSTASKAIMKELRKTIKEFDSTPPLQRFWQLDTQAMGDRVNVWQVKLFNFDSGLPLAKDLAFRKVSYILLEVQFWTVS